MTTTTLAKKEVERINNYNQNVKMTDKRMISIGYP